MMDQIRQFDWCAPLANAPFVTGKDLDHCCTEKILRNKFHDPLIPSDEEEDERPDIDWKNVFSQRLKNMEKSEGKRRIFVPCMRTLVKSPKLSALTKNQHYQCLKVLCEKNPHILPGEYMGRVKNLDYKVFEEVKEIYEKEQKEFLEWAKTLWATQHCVRALRPKPIVETVYAAEYNMKWSKLKSLPKKYALAAQIPLEMKDHTCEMICKKDLVKVNISDLPEIDYPEPINEKFCIMQECPLPEPCNKHPCNFILPNESSVSTLPLTQIHKELAQFAADNGADYIASENALKCLMELDTNWSIPISVCETVTQNGERRNVAVLGSPFSLRKEPAPVRTYRAFRHLLCHKFISEEARTAANKRRSKANTDNHVGSPLIMTLPGPMDEDDDDSEDDNRLLIDLDLGDEHSQNKVKSTKRDSNTLATNNNITESSSPEGKPAKVNEMEINDIGSNECVCKGTPFETPPLRSFKLWQVSNTNLNEHYNIVVYCSHKAQSGGAAAVLEPAPEHQLELGAARPPPARLRALALALLLRGPARLVTVRVEGSSGDVCVITKTSAAQFKAEHGELVPDVTAALAGALHHLQGLLPGAFVLDHDRSHGANALLYGSRGGSGAPLELQGGGDVCGAEEARYVQVPPPLAPVLLPVHKFCKVLPCAFTPFEQHVAKETKKAAAAKTKQPPPALQWPKKKRRNRKRKRNSN